jgi:hypothetical protein
VKRRRRRRSNEGDSNGPLQSAEINGDEIVTVGVETYYTGSSGKYMIQQSTKNHFVVIYSIILAAELLL